MNSTDIITGGTCMNHISTKRQSIIMAARCAFPYTIPIFAGFWFLGMTYGIYMNVSGFSFVYPMIMSLIIFGGSLEFVAVKMLMSAYAPMQTLIMTLMIQARHLFYGISMLDRFKGMGLKNFIFFTECVMRAFLLTIQQKFQKMWIKAGLCFL